MDLTIKKDSRAGGKFFHKMPRVGATKQKQQAKRDITEYCGECNSIYNRNYLHYEADIMSMSKIDTEEITTNLHIID